jgi:branched-subunit amino acid transport protein
VTAWIVVICVGIGSLAFRMAPLAFAGRSTSPRTSRLIKDAGAAATAAITVAWFDRAAQSGDVAAIAVAGVVAFVLALRGSSMLRVVAVGIGLYVALSYLLAW